MTAQDLEYINKTPKFLAGHDISRPEPWVKAFDEYNADHPTDRPMQMQCIPCYIKVWKYMQLKYKK